jgi:hypothetical protein
LPKFAKKTRQEIISPGQKIIQTSSDTSQNWKKIVENLIPSHLNRSSEGSQSNVSGGGDDGGTLPSLKPTPTIKSSKKQSFSFFSPPFRY